METKIFASTPVIEDLSISRWYRCTNTAAGGRVRNRSCTSAPHRGIHI